jgi:RHS repeat-associated protein
LGTGSLRGWVAMSWLAVLLAVSGASYAARTELADARRIEYRYADPAYRRTQVRVQVEDEFLETRTRYDGSGNAVETVDPRGKVTTREFDGRDRLQTQLEPEGRTLTYTYDGADNRLSETLSGPGLAAPQVRTDVPDGRNRERRRVDATGGAWETEYDAAGRIARRIDPRLNAVSYRYDARGRLVEEAGPVPGRITRYGVDAVGNRTDEVHANGRTLVHEFDALNRRVASRDSEGDFERPEFERLAYDEDGHVVSRTDANGHVTTYVIDALGRTTAEQRPLGRTLGWTHTIHGEVATETDGEGATTTHQYDGAGRRVLTIAPAPFGYETRVAYDAAGNRIAQTDGRGLTTDWTFDDLNRRVSQTDPAIGAERYVQTWAHDAAGNPIAHVDRRGIEHRAEFDGENRELVRRREGVLQVTRTFDAAGNLVGETDAGGHLTTYAYNGANEKTQTTRPENAVETWTYLPWGEVETQTDADGITTGFDYDLRRRMIRETRPHADGPAVTTHAYDGQGNRIETTRPLGPSYRWQYRFDAAHRLDQVTSPEGAVTQYAYDRADRRTRITDAEERDTTTAFDALGRVTRVDFANGDAERIDSYDANGNITARTDGNGQSIASQFDALNRITERTYAGPPAPADVIRETWSYTPNGEATRLGQHTADGTEHVTQRAWDRQGRLTEDTNRHGQLTQHVYDDDGVRLRRTDASGATVFQPDALHRIRSVQPAGETPIAIEVTPGGRLQTQTPPNGATTTHTYDAGGRIATITHRQHDTVVATLTYVYDLNGNRTSETQVASTGTRTTTYVYDRDDRLTGTTLTDDAGVVTDSVYTLDAVGNRLTEVVTVDGVVIANKIYTYSPRHQLETVTDSVASLATTYTYDDNGFTTSETVDGQTTTYRPNLQDRLATLTTPTGPPVHYAYDPDGLRVEKRTNAEATRYGYDGTSLRRETNVANNELATYDWVSGRVLRTRRTGLTSYAQHDALKSPVRWSRADGGEQGRVSFDAWGNRWQSSGTLPPISYTGYYADDESGDYYAQQRYYQPRVGRFNRVDPWAGDKLSPITLSSKYLYANGNPPSYIDPDGRSATLVGAGGGLVYGLTQGIGRSAYDWWNGHPQQGWENFGNVVAQNTIAGAEIGLPLDVSRAGMNPLSGATSGALFGAGTDGLTFDGQAQTWNDFASGQLKYGAGGAVAGATLASGAPAMPLYQSVAGRLGIQGLSGVTAGYGGDFVTQSIELATGERHAYDQARLNLSATVGGLANLVPTALQQAVPTRQSASPPKVGGPQSTVVGEGNNPGGVQTQMVHEPGQVPVVANSARTINPLRAGQLHEAEQLAQLGVGKNTVVFRPTAEQVDTATFRAIVGEPKYTPGGQLRGTIFDGNDISGNIEIKGGRSELNSTYQLRLQTYKSVIDGQPFSIQTTRPINPVFQEWLDFWGVKIVTPGH